MDPGELIRYLEHRKSGALEFDDMGDAWVGVREAVAAGTLRPSDKGVAEVVAKFDALLRFASLQLGRKLGTEVVPVLSPKELADPAGRAQALTASLCAAGEMSGAIRIPDTVGHLVITADLRASRITCHVDVDAPREGRPTTRINWLLRQLKEAPGTTRIEAFVAYARGSSAAELLASVRDSPTVLLVDHGKELRSFRVATVGGLGPKRGRGRGAFIDSVLTAVDTFYADVLGSLQACSAAPPKLRPAHPTVPEVDDSVAANLVSTDYSSQDHLDGHDRADHELPGGHIDVAVNEWSLPGNAPPARPSEDALDHAQVPAHPADVRVDAGDSHEEANTGRDPAMESFQRTK